MNKAEGRSGFEADAPGMDRGVFGKVTWQLDKSVVVTVCVESYDSIVGAVDGQELSGVGIPAQAHEVGGFRIGWVHGDRALRYLGSVRLHLAELERRVLADWLPACQNHESARILAKRDASAGQGIGQGIQTAVMVWNHVCRDDDERFVQMDDISGRLTGDPDAAIGCTTRVDYVRFATEVGDRIEKVPVRCEDSRGQEKKSSQ